MKTADEGKEAFHTPGKANNNKKLSFKKLVAMMIITKIPKRYQRLSK